MRPRTTIPIGGSKINGSDLRGLSRAWREGQLVPVLGAGVSMPHGTPAWKDLVVSLLFEHSAEARAMRGFSVAQRRAVAAWLADYVDYDLTILARVVKNSARKLAKRRGAGSPRDIEQEFLTRIRDHIYPTVTKPPRGETTLTALADLIARGAKERRIPAVVTFNYDDLLEEELTRRKVPHHSVWTDRHVEPRGIPIVHPHGFLPRRAVSHGAVVFSEDEYHQLGGAVFHWAHSEVVHHLRRHTALFVGLSMSDPNLRRLLDASYVHGDVPAHWQLQKRRVLGKSAVRDAAADIGRRAGEIDDPDAMRRVLLAGLKLAERFDRELHQGMGVKTIWLAEHADIPPLLRAIPGADARPAGRVSR